MLAGEGGATLLRPEGTAVDTGREGYPRHRNPRGARVVALERPFEREGSQWYLQRYVAHLSAPGDLAQETEGAAQQLEQMSGDLVGQFRV